MWICLEVFVSFVAMETALKRFYFLISPFSRKRSVWSLAIGNEKVEFQKENVKCC